MALTVKKVEKLIGAGTPGRFTDGAKDGGVRGLMLVIESKTSAAWLLRWQRDGRVRHMGLGSARDLSLAAAREKACRERERLAIGLQRGALAFRQIHRHASGQERRGHHKDDEKHQHHVDERRDVDLRHGPMPPDSPSSSATRAACASLKRCAHKDPLRSASPSCHPRQAKREPGS